MYVPIGSCDFFRHGFATVLSVRAGSKLQKFTHQDGAQRALHDMSQRLDTHSRGSSPERTTEYRRSSVSLALEKAASAVFPVRPEKRGEDSGMLDPIETHTVSLKNKGKHDECSSVARAQAPKTGWLDSRIRFCLGADDEYIDKLTVKDKKGAEAVEALKKHVLNALAEKGIFYMGQLKRVALQDKLGEILGPGPITNVISQHFDAEAAREAQKTPIRSFIYAVSGSNVSYKSMNHISRSPFSQCQHSPVCGLLGRCAPRRSNIGIVAALLLTMTFANFVDVGQDDWNAYCACQATRAGVCRSPLELIRPTFPPLVLQI